MLKLTLLLAAVCFLAYTTKYKRAPTGGSGNVVVYHHPGRSFSIFLMIVLLTLLIGLRTDFNDTGAYISGFINAPTFSEFIKEPKNLNLLQNPLFYGYTALFRKLTDNYHVYFMVSALLVTVPTIVSLRKLVDRELFPLVIFTYFTLGTYLFALAAMKQTMAMAISCCAIVALLERKYPKFFVLAILAGLTHAYAFALLVLPLLVARPWTTRTYIILAITLFLMLTFEESITRILEEANELGKSVDSSQVFSGEGMNLFRVAVYGVIPVTSLLYRRRLEPQMGRKEYLFLHMSIVSFMFMLLASIDGANIFGRMARYFEIGLVYMYPWTLQHLFSGKNRSVAKFVYVVCFFVFFAYGYWDFSSGYHAITLLQFIKSLV